MTNKYISHGNTFDGDGTTKDAAASNGGVGAWNDLKAIMSAVPTYGTLVAGDTVNIRSQISSVDVTAIVVNGANVTVLERGNRDDGPITWFVDDGTIWTGDNGKLTIQVTTAHSFIIDEYNYFKGIDQNLEIVSTVSSSSHHFKYIIYYNHVVMNSCILKTHSSSTNSSTTLIEHYSRVIFIDCLLWERAWYHISYHYLYTNIYSPSVYFFNCEFKTDFPSVTSGFIQFNGLGGNVNIIGGKTTGMNTSRVLFKTATSYSGLTTIRINGFDCNCIIQEAQHTNLKYLGTCMYSDHNPNVFDLFTQNQKGEVRWIRGDSFPYLNATLPDTTPYSLRYKQVGIGSVTPTVPFFAADLTKYFSGASATRKITLELLIDSALSNPMNAEYIMEVGYLSTDNEYKVEHTTIDWLNTISTSTASWNTTTYKTRSHSKYKLELTTTNQIKQYSNVTVRLKVGKPQSTSYYSFIDPDFIIGTP